MHIYNNGDAEFETANSCSWIANDLRRNDVYVSSLLF